MKKLAQKKKPCLRCGKVVTVTPEHRLCDRCRSNIKERGMDSGYEPHEFGRLK